jgi:hypothetical protein
MPTYAQSGSGCYLRGKRYNAEKKSEGAPSGNQNATKQLDQNDPVVSTADRLATEYKVSAPTIILVAMLHCGMKNKSLPSTTDR